MSDSRSSAAQYLSMASTVRARVDRFSGLTEQWVGLVNRLVALLLLLLLAPVLVWIAVRIWREDGAPIFFGHYRVGREGRLTPNSAWKACWPATPKHVPSGTATRSSTTTRASHPSVTSCAAAASTSCPSCSTC